MSPALIERLVAALVFVIGGIWLADAAPNREVAVVLWVLLLTIYLFAFEIVEVDVAAISIMALLGLTALFAPLLGIDGALVDPTQLFDGFASNAVISIIAVMIIGAGLDKTGLMSRVAAFILRVGGTTEARVIPMIAGTVGLISSFMQNVGAAALFLPVVSRISARTGLPMSRLLMPMGFCAILGGTVTMVGSSPLILLNDLILTSNEALPKGQVMATFGLFAVTPIGIALVAVGIAYFILAGRYVLPAQRGTDGSAHDTKAYLEQVYGVGYELREMLVPRGSALVGQSLDQIERAHRVRIVAVDKGDGPRFGAHGVDRSTGVDPDTVLGVLGAPAALDAFAQNNRLKVRRDLTAFAEALVPMRAGIAEVVIPPGSNLEGKSARDVWLRKTYGLSLLAIHRGGKTIMREGEGVRDIPLQSGDALVVHTTWQDLARLEQNPDFVVVTTEYPHEDLRPHKVDLALVSFAVALGLVLFSDLRVSVALLTGALGMVLGGVLKIDEAYRAVSWKTVFLLASLIPLGMAVEGTGTARWIAEQTLAFFGEQPDVLLVQIAVAVLATFFTLVMSNVGATVLLVPLAVNIAIGVDANPAVFALTVALSTSNSFLLPTHQVNALIMGPGGYRVPDFLRAGGIMTLLFIVVEIVMLNLVF